MPQNAWSLLIFTLLTQMSVGAFCVAELTNLSYSNRFGFEEINPLRSISRLFVFAAAILAGVSSIFHLKKWAHAYHAFNNLKASWVSKEMVLFFLFVSCVAVLALMSWRKFGAYLLLRAIGIAGALSGIALIYSMAQIYMLPTIPPWDYWTTPGLFFSSAFLLGTLAIVWLYSTHLTFSKYAPLVGAISDRWEKRTRPSLFKLLLFLTVLGILITAFFAYRVITVADEYGTRAIVMSVENQILFYMRIILYVSAWILLFLALKKIRQVNGNQNRLPWFFYAASLLIVCAEVVGRYLFYVSFYRIGV